MYFVIKALIKDDDEHKTLAPVAQSVADRPEVLPVGCLTIGATAAQNIHIFI